MLDRILEQRKPVTIVLADIDFENLDYSEWNLVEAIIEVLQPFEWATKTLSGDKYATLSMVIPLMSSILISLREMRCTVAAAEIVRKALIQAVENRFSDMEIDRTITTACILDPRFKTFMFIETSNRLKAVEALRTEMSTLEPIERSQTQIVVEVSPPNPSKRRKLDFWKIVDEQCNQVHDVNSYSVELDSYLAENCVNRETDIIMYWFENQKKFPLLYKLSLKYLCIPATSCSSERVFSKAGEIVSAKRSRLKPKNVNDLIFLNKNFFNLNSIKN